MGRCDDLAKGIAGGHVLGMRFVGERFEGEFRAMKLVKSLAEAIQRDELN